METEKKSNGALFASIVIIAIIIIGGIYVFYMKLQDMRNSSDTNQGESTQNQIPQ